ncbi:MAG: apolipoprotein N-acyltransferase [bacterium]
MSMSGMPAGALRLAGAVSSGLLLASCFSPLEWHVAAWFALVPLLLIAKHSTPGSAFKWGMLCGLIFWIPALSWLRILSEKGVPAPVAFLAWMLLATYCALYIAVFAMIVSSLCTACGTGNWMRNLALIVAISVIWVGLEYLRSNLASGFPWNTLGVSQALASNQFSVSVCQVAELGGGYAVSALIVLLNAGLTMTVISHCGVSVGRKYKVHPELTFSLICVTAAVMWGASVFARLQRPEPANMTIAIVQPNIAQLEKWDSDFAAPIYNSLIKLTRQSLAYTGVDLIVWPETSVPYPVFCDESIAFMADLLTNGVPILVGSTDDRLMDQGIIYNSSVLMDSSGKPLQIYNKQHLAPFGEYAPLSSLFSNFVARVAPEGWLGLTPGNRTVVFSLVKRPELCFAPLICFEDAFPGLARDAVRAGARLLIDQTNDAWFDVSSGARQHLSHCIFRCIENRVPAVRAANTGVSCFIDRAGRIPEDGILKQLTASSLPVTATIPSRDMPLTFYTRHGDSVFAFPCAVIAVLCFVLALMRTWWLRFKARWGNYAQNPAGPNS